MRKKNLVILIFLFVCFSLSSKTRILFFEQELKNATHISYVKVLSYSEATITVYQISDESIKIFSTRHREMSEAYRSEINIKGPSPNSLGMRGYWPKIGDSVLILTDSLKFINLMAIKIGKEYLFWNPNFIPFAECIFNASAPARPTVYCKEISPNPDYPATDGSFTCTDGCYYPAALIKER